MTRWNIEKQLMGADSPKCKTVCMLAFTAQGLRVYPAFVFKYQRERNGLNADYQCAA